MIYARVLAKFIDLVAFRSRVFDRAKIMYGTWADRRAWCAPNLVRTVHRGERKNFVADRSDGSNFRQPHFRRG